MDELMGINLGADDFITKPYNKQILLANAGYKILYKKTPTGEESIANPSKYLIGYLESQGVIIPKDPLVKEEFKEVTTENYKISNNNYVVDNSYAQNNSNTIAN